MALHEVILATIAGGVLLAVLGYGVWTHDSHERDLTEGEAEPLSRYNLWQC
jgi:hypothetical protein